MDERLKKRMLAFYFAGAVNLILGLYVLTAGAVHMGETTALLIGLFFLGFAAVDFYFPRAMKKKWLEDQARLKAAGQPDRAN